MLLLGGCSREAPPPKQSDSGKQNVAAKELVIVSTNDFHAALDRAEGMASTLRDLKKRYGDHMVYLDAGDLFQGSLEGNIGKGKGVIAFYNLLHPDATAIGNHEFDYGPDVPDRVTVRPGDDGMGNLKARVKEAKFPMLSANLVVDPPVSCRPGPNCNALGQQTVFRPRTIIERNGARVCVIGVTTPLTRNITNPAFLKGTKFLDLKSVVQAEASWLKSNERCDWVVLLAHEGLRYEADGKTLKSTGLLPWLQEIPASTVDAVIGGHSHTPMQQVINGTPVVQAGKSAKFVSVLHLQRDNAGKKYRFDPWIEVPDRGVAFDVTSELMFYRQQAFEYKKSIIGATTAPFLYDKSKETALGNLVTDALRKINGVQTDCALMNAGAIRSNLPRGKISNDNIFRLMPFDDTIVIADLTGAELRELVEVACSGALGLCSQSGLQIKKLDVASHEPGPWDRDLNKDGKKEEWERNVILDVKDSQGKSLDPNRTYRVTTSSYLVEGGDFQDVVYDRIPASRIHYYFDLLVRDVLHSYFSKQSPLDPNRYYVANRPRMISVLPQQ